MKYTNHLIKGNYFEPNHERPENLIFKVAYVGFMSFCSVCFLGFCFSLLPFAVTFDIFRTAYCMEIKLSRKIKNFDYAKLNVFSGSGIPKQKTQFTSPHSATII